MATFNFSDPRNAKAVIADYLTELPDNVLTATRREEVVNNSARPVLLLLEAGALAYAAGAEEEAVFIHFVRTLHAQIELHMPEKDFVELLHKLTDYRRMH